MILFAVLTDRAANFGQKFTCFRCDQEIKRVEDLSIEHKVQWRTPEQFWNLANIAFSHLRCNSGAGERHRAHSRSTYERVGCRCERCTAANTEHSRKLRARYMPS